MASWAIVNPWGSPACRYTSARTSSYGVTPVVVAFAVGAHRVGGGLLGGVELAQVELNPRGVQIGARALERIGGRPPGFRLGEVAGSLITAAHDGIGGRGSPVQLRGEGWYLGVLGCRCELAGREPREPAVPEPE